MVASVGTWLPWLQFGPHAMHSVVLVVLLVEGPGQMPAVGLSVTGAKHLVQSPVCTLNLSTIYGMISVAWYHTHLYSFATAGRWQCVL